MRVAYIGARSVGYRNPNEQRLNRIELRLVCRIQRLKESEVEISALFTVNVQVSAAKDKGRDDLMLGVRKRPGVKYA